MATRRADGLARGTVRAPSKLTVREAAEAWLTGAQDGSIRNRSGDSYKPSVIRSYETSLRLHLLPKVGHIRLGDLTRNEVQDLADRMVARGADPSTVRNAVMPLRVVYRRAVNRGDVAVSPTIGSSYQPCAAGEAASRAQPRQSG